MAPVFFCFLFQGSFQGSESLRENTCCPYEARNLVMPPW
jgi:hypothetical protein